MKKFKKFAAIAIALAFLAISAAASAEKPTEKPADVIDHQPFEELLKKFVDPNGMVDYSGWHASESDRQALSAYVAAIGSASMEDRSESSRLAFYLNAYNALVLHDVLARWPVKTVMDEEGFFDGKKHPVAGQKMTLNELEHDKVIRVQFAEPRIHFVLVCAARDCPRLRTTALTAENLERELAAATREFVPRTTTLRDGKIVASQLFNWFAEDFERAAGSVPAYLATNIRDLRLRAALAADDVEVEFSEYDWSLNNQ